MKQTRYYFDSNTFSYCLWDRPGSLWTDRGRSALRAAMAHAIRTDAIAILGSQYHIEEASRMPGGIRRQWVNFFWNTVLWYLLLPTNELAKLEASLRRPLTTNEPFDEVHRRRAFRSVSLRNGATELNALAPAVETFAKKFAADQKARRVAVKAQIAGQYKGKTAHQITKTWWSQAAIQIEDWVKDYIQKSSTHLGLPADPAEWPTPRQLQTAWAMHSYQMARIVMTVGLGRAIGDGDAHDAHHYAGACFADCLVTHDAGFRDTIKLIPDAIDVKDLDGFAATLGVTPH